MKTGSEKENSPAAAEGGSAQDRGGKPEEVGAVEAGLSPLKIEQILVPVDFSEPSKRALRCAIKFAEHFSATITLLHVVEPLDQPDFAYFPLTLDSEKVTKMAQKKLDVLSRPQPGGTCPVHMKLVRTGKPFQVITETARELKVDLIVISTHGYTGVKHVFLGSTAERVVRHAPCAVLTVRETQAAGPGAGA